MTEEETHQLENYADLLTRVAGEMAVEWKKQKSEIETLRQSLNLALDTLAKMETDLLPHYETNMLNGGEVHPDIKKVLPLGFAEWSYYANTIRDLKKVLEES